MSLLIGERMNRATWRPKQCLVPSSYYLDLMLRLRAFRHEAGALRSLGIRWDASMNLLPPDPQIIGWNAPLAHKVATKVHEILGPKFGLIWLVGRKVASAFGIESVTLFQSYTLDNCPDNTSTAYVVLPHPSGLNRWWHNANLKAAREDVRKVQEYFK